MNENAWFVAAGYSVILAIAIVLAMIRISGQF
jgi:hypothetical protein